MIPVPPSAIGTTPSEMFGFWPPVDDSGALAATERMPVLESVNVPPSGTEEPPESPDPELMFMEEFASTELGTLPAWKKAIVTLHSEDRIEFF